MSSRAAERLLFKGLSSFPKAMDHKGFLPNFCNLPGRTRLEKLSAILMGVFLCLVPLGEALARSYQLSLWTFVQLVPLGEPHLQCYQLSLRVFLWLGSNSVRGEG
jgi:hypothetical protein